MPPTNGSAAGSFCEEATSVVVAFKDGHRDADSVPDEHPHRLRMSFKAAYNLPIVTFRFHVNVFGHDDSGKKEKTTLYFDVPPHHISSLEHTHHVDTAELAQEDLEHFSGGLTRVRFLLKRPGNLVQPVRDLTLKPGSQRIFASLTSLAAALDFDLFVPHTTLSKEQLRRLEQAVASPISRHDLQEQHKERDWWLGALYGGVGGRLFDPADDSTDSECESTIATATPPAYRRAVDAVDDAADDADSPPPYDQLESEAADPADIKGSCSCFWVKYLLTFAGKQRGKRLRDSPDPDVRLHRRRTCSPPVAGACLEKLESNPVALVLSKLEQVLKENKSLRAELLAMRHRQDQLEDMIRRGAKEEHRDKRTQTLEADAADLDTRVSSLEERQAELEDRQGKTEDKCDTIEVEIADQVHSALRERLIGALETMQ
ncbi:hypothetical protein PG993_014225 [Apiospora rasikravindrae]|uniref:Uncharacterized protein n=1 Tax=Apiospora rasikravindrae TaxID=990691 RepID=A0ABR1RTL5_9PEZI